MSIFAQITEEERDLFMDRAMERACSELRLDGLHATVAQVQAAEALARNYFRKMCEERSQVRGMLMGR